MSDHDHNESPIDPRILQGAQAGCEQSKFLVNRRALLGLSASLFTWAYLPRVSEAATGKEPRLLVVVLRGGMDGLHVAVPTDDPKYQSVRGTLALTEADTLPLPNSAFRIHKAMVNFQRMYAAGSGAIVQAIAPPLRIRSHFECQYNLETGNPDTQVRAGEVGWLNRLLGKLPAGRAVKCDALGVGPAPLILAGPEPVLAWSPGPAPRSDLFDSTLQRLYDAKDPELAKLLASGLQTNDLATMQGVSTEKTPLLTAFKGAGRLLSAVDGPRIAVLSIEGWDTHVSQLGTLTARLTDLDTSLQGFREEIGDSWSNTVVLCVTEFGRTVARNGTAGTDHGVGTVAFMAGGAVAGGKIYGQWPGLNDLQDGRDLKATTDLRQLFKGVLADHLGVPASLLDNTVFPDSADVPGMKDLIRSSTA